MTPCSRLKPKNMAVIFSKLFCFTEQKNTLNKETDFIYDATEKSSGYKQEKKEKSEDLVYRSTIVE